MRQLYEIEKRVKEATPGEWSLSKINPKLISIPEIGGAVVLEMGEANAIFISEAKRDILFLTDKVRVALAALEYISENSDLNYTRTKQRADRAIRLINHNLDVGEKEFPEALRDPDEETEKIRDAKRKLRETKKQLDIAKVALAEIKAHEHYKCHNDWTSNHIATSALDKLSENDAVRS